MVVFLVVAGLTGGLLAFYSELDRALNPELLRVSPPSPGAALLDPLELHARVKAQLPAEQAFHNLSFKREPAESRAFWIEIAPEEWRETFVDPYTGKILGSRDWDAAPTSRQNVMPFVYQLHYSLALGEVGTLLFGIVALLWTLDCFVGAYLTFPVAQARPASGARVSWFRRWYPAFLLKTGKLWSLVFSFHRASGLWVWAMLLVFAWSAVGMNLRQVYTPVMTTLAGMRKEGHDLLPQLSPPFPEPALSAAEALAVGRRLMAKEARRREFSIEREVFLYYAEDHGAFAYAVASSLDISEKNPRTQVFFDQNGRFIAFDAPTGITPGNTLSSVLFSLHVASIGGVGYRIFVSLLGLTVAALTVSGVLVWWRKRERRTAKARTKSADELFDSLEPVGFRTLRR
jgi:uncharacterized iron-regulated membrane protein